MDYDIQDKNKLYLIPVGDLHVGSPETNYEYLDYWKEVVNRIKAPKRIYLLGDLLEVASKRLDNSAFQVTMSVDEQLDFVIDFFKPFLDDIVFSANGNHELRLLKEHDLDLNKQVISRNLKCPYGNQYIDTFQVNNQPFKVYIKHGKGTSAHFYTAESKTLRECQAIDADIFIEGHNHRCGYFSIPLRSANRNKRRHYAYSGSFLGYGGYADVKQLPILLEAFLYLTINSKLRVDRNIFYIDERRSDLMRELP